MVGGRGRPTRPQYCRPGGTGDRQPSEPSRRTRPYVPPTRGASVAGSQSPRTSRGCLRKKTGLWVGANKKETPNPQASKKHQRQERNRQKHQPSQTSDSHQQARPSATRDFKVWPDIPPTRELESDARGRNRDAVSAREQRNVSPQPLSTHTEPMGPCQKHLSGYFLGCLDETRCVHASDSGIEAPRL